MLPAKGRLAAIRDGCGFFVFYIWQIWIIAVLKREILKKGAFYASIKAQKDMRRGWNCVFCVEIAGIPIGIENQYPFVYKQCEGYIERAKPPAFKVSVSEKEVLEEQNGNFQFSRGYCESLCLYRKICCKLAVYDAFLMHASVIAVDGVAYAFTAPSGIGKTTHTKLWLKEFGERVQVVNGDKPVFRFIGDTLYACGTPWQGKEGLGNNIMCPLKAVCFLEQSKTNHIRLLRPDEVTERIFHQILIPKEEEEFNEKYGV